MKGLYYIDIGWKDAVLSDLSGRYSGRANYFSAASSCGQEARRSLLDIKSDCPGSEEDVKVLLDDEGDLPEAVEEEESKCLGSSRLERCK